MSSNRRHTLGFLALLLFCVAAIAYTYRKPILNRLRSLFGNRGAATHSKPADCPGCADYFPDVVAVMDRAYKQEKIKPQTELVDLDNLLRSGILVEIHQGSRYVIDHMEHSRPYVLPVVVSFLEELASVYEKKLQERGLSYSPFIITSGTRSIQSAKELTEENDIARTQSHHLLGKTIDISYKRFGDRRAEQRCFIEALRTLREQDRCYVKYEQSGALHLTVR